MKISRSINFILVILPAFISGFIKANAAAEYFWCSNPRSRCYGKYVKCPDECPSTSSENLKSKVCCVNCDNPHCKPECKQHFSLVSDSNLQINGRFIGHRPAGRTRDFTWIQALGILFNSYTFSLEATKAATWDSEIDHLKFTYNGQDLAIPEGSLSIWYSPEKDVKVERVSSRNNCKEDDRVHKYQVPENDCFVHLEVQFRFFYLSPKVDGVLGRTYRPDFENPAKPGVAMPVLGGEEKYRTPCLLSAACQTCIFSLKGGSDQKPSSVMDYGTLDCTRGASAGYGIVCRK
ncbi:hypothetical protein P3X46_013623 [Hevea brasiliensis]|uniref:Uncharacterized protein n=1 Tax=Hevea brasiliensis TaxID=3981 RepID=A0ABQ9M434_HEVBR|nr:hypothetical protein P3X46_013623 [Hevea brasiliensis]